MSLEDNLVPDRKCGKCTECCISLKIDDDELKKDAGCVCPHLIINKGCGIYSDRPDVCKNWHCGWRILDQLGPDFRPDRIKIIIRIDEHHGSLAFTLQPIGPAIAALTQKKVLSFIGSTIESGLPLFISIPTTPGFCSCRMQINEILKDAISTHHFPTVRQAMKDVIISASKSKTDPI